MNKREREEREYKSLMTDERFAKKAWKELIGESLNGLAKPLRATDPKTGELTPQAQLEQMAYDNVKARLNAEGKERDPMQAEMLIECRIIASRADNGTFGTLLDRTAGKVKDEISVSHSQYEDLTDEELDAISVIRSKKNDGGNNG